MITHVDDSLLDNLTEKSVILQQVGTKGWIGNGLTKQIFEKWHDAFMDYHCYCNWFKDGHDDEIIGSWHRTKINEDLILCNAITQKTIGKSKQLVDYDAWEKVCKKLERQTKYANQKLNTNWTIHTFEKIGSSAEAEQDKMMEIFETYFGDSPVELVIHAH